MIQGFIGCPLRIYIFPVYVTMNNMGGKQNEEPYLSCAQSSSFGLRIRGLVNHRTCLSLVLLCICTFICAARSRSCSGGLT